MSAGDQCRVCLGFTHPLDVHGTGCPNAPVSAGDHPHTDPGDGRTECDVCGKWVWLVTHSCKGVPVTQAATERMRRRVWENARMYDE